MDRDGSGLKNTETEQASMTRPYPRREGLKLIFVEKGRVACDVIYEREPTTRESTILGNLRGLRSDKSGAYDHLAACDIRRINNEQPSRST